jgi:nucleotide-binding universal stress UspA family protein
MPLTPVKVRIDVGALNILSSRVAARRGENKMYKHILIAADGSELATKAVAHGLDLAKALGAKATVVMVTEPMWSAMPGEIGIVMPHKEFDEAVAANAQRVLSAAAEMAKQKGVNCSVMHVKDQFPAEGINGCAQESGCDLIVMATHGRRGLAKLVLGSQAARVVTTSTIPVLVYR